MTPTHAVALPPASMGRRKARASPVVIAREGAPGGPAAAVVPGAAHAHRLAAGRRDLDTPEARTLVLVVEAAHRLTQVLVLDEPLPPQVFVHASPPAAVLLQSRDLVQRQGLGRGGRRGRQPLRLEYGAGDLLIARRELLEGAAGSRRRDLRGRGSRRRQCEGD